MWCVIFFNNRLIEVYSQQNRLMCQLLSCQVLAMLEYHCTTKINLLDVFLFSLSWVGLSLFETKFTDTEIWLLMSQIVTRLATQQQHIVVRWWTILRLKSVIVIWVLEADPPMMKKCFFRLISSPLYMIYLYVFNQFRFMT